MILLFIGAGLCLGLQDLSPNAFSDMNMRFFDAFYFMIVTCTTIGYGDILPTDSYSRFLVILIIICLFFFISDQLNKISTMMMLLGDGIKSYDGQEHIILILDNTIQLGNFLTELMTNKENTECDILVITTDKLVLPSRDPPYNKVLLMFVNQIDFEALIEVNIKYARAIFIFCSKNITNCILKEKITELILLQINQFNINKDKIFIQSLYFDHSIESKKSLTHQLINKMNSIEQKFTKKASKSDTMDSGGTSKNILLKNRIPIFKLKNKIISKSLVAPGFATFIQNIMFNNYSSPENVDELAIVMKNYYYGCENKLYVRPVPECFIGRTFFYFVRFIYLQSIKKFFTNVLVTGQSADRRPIIAIGLIEREDNHSFLEFFPSKLTLRKESQIIFISYNSSKSESGCNHLDKFLKSFENLILDKPSSKKKEEELDIDEENIENLNEMQADNKSNKTENINKTNKITNNKMNLL